MRINLLIVTICYINQPKAKSKEISINCINRIVFITLIANNHFWFRLFGFGVRFKNGKVKVITPNSF